MNTHFNERFTAIIMNCYGPFKVCNMDQEADIVFERALITLISDNINYRWYSFSGLSVLVCSKERAEYRRIFIKMVCLAGPIYATMH